MVKKETNSRFTPDSFWGDGEKSQTGHWVSWYEDRQNKEEGWYKNGRKDGGWTEWYENGQKKRETYYNHGQNVSVNGWYEDGQMKEEGWYKYGEKDGRWTEWYENGQKRTENTYKNGKNYGSSYLYNGDSELILFETKYDKKGEEIIHVNYDENDGVKKEETILYDGYPDIVKRYYKNGNLMFEIPWESGISKYWFDNGIKSHEGELFINRYSERDGNFYYETGKWTYWYPSGNKFKEGEYDISTITWGGNDDVHRVIPIGIWKFWNEDGVQSYEVEFGRNDVMVEDFFGKKNFRTLDYKDVSKKDSRFFHIPDELDFWWLYDDKGNNLFNFETP